MKKVRFVTLGCKVNQYETQALKEKFLQRGYEIVSENDFADVYVINTCTVTGLFSTSWTSPLISFGMVAENRRVCRCLGV